MKPRILSLLCVTLVVTGCAREAIPADPGLVRAEHGLVVSASKPASEAGLAILKQGGNAVDAAVATAFALAVTFPEAGNLGGGGFMLLRPDDHSPPVCVDYRETAPAAATTDMFIDESSRLGPKIAGVPGTLRGLELAHRRWGKLEWPRLLEPAIKLAQEGFLLDAAVAASLNKVLADAQEFPELRRVLAKPGGGTWAAGDRLVQNDLAETLRQIAQGGADAFYTGTVADKLLAEMEQAGGLITRDDLGRYEAKVRPAVHGTYRGYDVFGPPPPSAGGIALIEMLNILETFDLKKQGRWSPETCHLIVESMRRGYRDRACYLGDPDFVHVPEHLTSKKYARELAQQIDREHATPSASLAGDIKVDDESASTTHFSIVDSRGMAVSNTYTLEQKYGCRVMVRGAGFLLNNEMGDFNWRPGHTDRGGAIGTAPNLIEPGKRMLSSQTPVIVLRDGRLAMVTGSPGGRTITNTVLCVLINVLEFEMDLRAAVDAPRLHQQWFPDRVQLEGVREREFRDLVQRLRAMGHTVMAPSTPQGDAHSIWVQDGAYLGAADHRISGHAAGF